MFTKNNLKQIKQNKNLKKQNKIEQKIGRKRLYGKKFDVAGDAFSSG